MLQYFAGFNYTTATAVMFKNVANSSPTGLWLSDEEGNLTYLNKTLVDWTGMAYNDLLGHGWANAIIDEDRQRSAELFIAAVSAKIHYDVRFRMRKGDGSIMWCHAAGDPFYDEKGKYTGYTGFCMDINEQVIARKKIEESELFARSIIEHSPVAKLVFTGIDMIIDIVNENMLSILGRDASIIGQPFMEAMPELKNTEISARLRQVFMTGETYTQPEEKIDLVRFGKPYTGYYNYIYKALRNTAGIIYGIIVTATEITDQVVVRKQMEETAFTLRGAIELAQLGTWSMDVATGIFDLSSRLKEWLNIEENAIIDLDKIVAFVAEADKTAVRESFINTMQEGGSGLYDLEYKVYDKNGGRKRILHSQGKAIYDKNGKITRVGGTVQDVTTQRTIQLALEEEVAVRTEELQSVNEELTSTNEELYESNGQLIRSNEELAQFAYIASHDLQEPLRKIRVFSGLLKNQENLSVENNPLVDKIALSAERMSLLINDLLDFSRLLKAESLMRPVDLAAVIRAVISDFELVIEEKLAIINIAKLPVIEGVGLQMNQLFYNLFSNALKFTSPQKQPVISITNSLISSDEAEKFVSRIKPGTDYYSIIFQDNGIGFDVKYAEQIFEVFKRLHGKDIYPGSGIGLALCRRIVGNHSGYMFAKSSPGNGSEFHIILPAHQKVNEAIERDNINKI